MPEVLAEAYQMILRVAGVKDPYELLRGLTRGASLTLDELHRFVSGLPVSEDVKERMKRLRPKEYVGLSTTICDSILAEAAEWLGR